MDVLGASRNSSGHDPGLKYEFQSCPLKAQILFIKLYAYVAIRVVTACYKKMFKKPLPQL